MPTWTATPEDYEGRAGFVAELAGPVRALLGPVDGLRVLDLGCGDGRVTAALAAQGADVLGVDADAAMVERTAARGVEAQVADARTLDGVDGPFDAVFSNAVLHWVDDPDAVARAVAGVLRPGGVFVAEQGGHGNVAAVRVALRAALDGHGLAGVAVPSWSFPTADAAAATLEDAGFTVETVELVPRPTPVPAGAAAWLDTFAAGIAPACGDAWGPVRDEAVARLAPVLRDTTGAWTLDYVRLRWRASLAV